MTSHPYLRKNILSLSSKAEISKRFLLLSVGCAVLHLAYSQADKRLLLADQYFAAGEYYTAAGLYEQFLNPLVKQKAPTGFPLNSKKNTEGKTGSYTNKADIQYKQAESYRLANYWAEASNLYQQCFQKDSAKYATALYWYAVCQRSMGNYTEAEKSINRFLTNTFTDASYKEKAEGEKDILQFIKRQLTRPDSVLYQVKKIETIAGTERGVFAPIAVGTNQFLITSTQKDSVAIPGINPNHNRLFSAILNDGSLQNIEPITVEGVDVSLNQGTASVSADGNYLYFTQWKKENGRTVAAIYYATKKESGWSKPVALNLINTEGYCSQQPFCSADGKYLFFASDRPGGMGNFDIWYAVLNADGTTGEPVNAGVVINTKNNELAPFYHDASNTLVFSSDRAPGMGGYDLFASVGKETAWKNPENMGHPVNSSRDDLYFFAPQKNNLLAHAIVSSDRGSECCLATYTVVKAAKKKMITGEVLDCKDNTPVAGAEVGLTDASGKTVSTSTNENGRYNFELNAETVGQLSVHKEKYSDKTAAVVIEGSNEKGWLIDTLYNATLCVERKLVIKVENVVTIYFDFDQSKLKDRGLAQLDSIYTVLM